MQSSGKQITRSADIEAAGLDLFPISVVALGCPSGPAQRLMVLQSAVAKAVAIIAAVRVSSLRLPHPAWLHLRAQ